MRLLPLALVATWLACAAAPRGAAAQPSEFLGCFGGVDLTDCSDVSVGDLFDFLCPTHQYQSYRGRVAWRPILYLGPVMIEVWAAKTTNTRFPLYFEFLPLAGRDPSLGYCDGPGQVLAAVAGHTECGSETYGPFYLSRFGVQVGSPFVVRAHFLGSSPRAGYESPYLWCVRVWPASTSIVGLDWGRVKRLYK